MKQISSKEDFKRLVVNIIQDGGRFFESIKQLEDPLDFYQVYGRVIWLAQSKYEVNVVDSCIPFFMKFDLVTICISNGLGDEAIDKFMEKILSIPLDSDSQLINSIKNDARISISVADWGCTIGKFEPAYDLLHHVYNRLSSIPSNNYETIIRYLAMLMETLNSVMQLKLYGEKGDTLNHALVVFSLEYMKKVNSKKYDTEVYKRLAEEYPEILKVYDQAAETLKRFETSKSILY